MDESRVRPSGEIVFMPLSEGDKDALTLKVKCFFEPSTNNKDRCSSERSLSEVANNSARFLQHAIRTRARWREGAFVSVLSSAHTAQNRPT